MLAYYGRDKDYLKKLANCLVRASQKDPLSDDIHGDGWGVAALTTNKLVYYRSHLPIFEDKDNLESIIDSLDGEVKVIIHARQASDKNLVSVYYSHPYLESNHERLLFLAHNGSVDKYKLGEMIGIDPTLMVDSELVAKYLSIYGIKEVDKLRDVTQSALNLLLLEINRKDRSSHLFYYNYYRKDKIRRKEDYYKLYLHNGAVYSSSLAYTGCEKGEEVELGKLLVLNG
ncbi:class II glutamine amidotransferase [Saccharolobus solfataricus]|nr:class II glutamine amidotransferase [Saccharolobus solfataricus]AKA77322.2 class II glutamine amidotransferase [Saccharolobus solfataricus]AKA80013.2 class II glutamine amidotransferase [Saccharolobus solfataricus]AZF69095.1 class II glutamine amidotransferase [Saccharolobus solfataricus]AZF71715.1 class II glutamine amidotransferase [Saccharolobus solfataricus]